MKKFIMILLLINTFLFAGDINLRNIIATYQNGTVTLVMQSQDKNAGGFPHRNSEDWIGIYKKGDTNDWDNVLTWAWVKDFGKVDVEHGESMLQKNINLAAGDYEVRYFRNNSFTTYKKSSFTVAGDNTFHVTGVKANYKGGRVHFSIRTNDMLHLNIGQKDWVGLYKKGDNNDWDNVLTWAWAKDFEQFDGFTLTYNTQKINLENGEYEVRYFRNNSFTTYKKFAFFAVKGGNDHLSLTDIGASYIDNKVAMSLEYTHHVPLGNGPKDWVGIYKKGDNNDWDNVLTWAWAKDFKIGNIGINRYVSENINLQRGEYEIRYFLNNTFTTYMKSTFIID